MRFVQFLFFKHTLEHFSNTLWLKKHRDGDFLWDNVYNGMDYFGYMCIK